MSDIHLHSENISLKGNIPLLEKKYEKYFFLFGGVVLARMASPDSNFDIYILTVYVNN